MTEAKEKTKTGRKLAPLPAYGAELSQWRDWLTAALRPAFGRVEDFVRHGRQRIDACELILLAPDGLRVGFAIDEQRLLSTAGSQRTTLVAATDGLVRPPALSRPEQEDVWTALVTIASVTANQDPRDEARDRIEQAEDAAVVIDGETLQGAGRLGALVALKRHGIFDRARAEGFIDARLRHDTPPPGPALLVDAQTGERWMRVGDVAAFLRYATGAPPMSQATLDGRLSAIGVERRRYAARRRSNGVHVAVKLYRLPPAGLADDDPDVVDVDVSEGA